nr:hypothetical protein 7 [Legionellales bacterium]
MKLKNVNHVEKLAEKYIEKNFNDALSRLPGAKARRYHEEIMEAVVVEFRNGSLKTDGDLYSALDYMADQYKLGESTIPKLRTLLAELAFPSDFDVKKVQQLVTQDKFLARMDQKLKRYPPSLRYELLFKNYIIGDPPLERQYKKLR